MSNIAPARNVSSTDASAADRSRQLLETAEAFDSVAGDYDGVRGNNALVQDMRREVWRWLDRTFEPRSRLIDLGCGTGLDAARMAAAGHHVTAIDSSARMLERTRTRVRDEGVGERVEVLEIGAHELGRIRGCGTFDGAYSNLGALNCVPDPVGLAEECARLVRPGGALVFAVIGRACPWEIGHYLARGNWRRVRVRFARGLVRVGLNGHVVWTRYYSPGELRRAFERWFAPAACRGLCVLAPPPYLTSFRERHRGMYEWLWRIDRRAAGWPVLRHLGDHFLMIMRRR